MGTVRASLDTNFPSSPPAKDNSVDKGGIPQSKPDPVSFSED